MPGLLHSISGTLRDLGLEVTKASVESDDRTFSDKFYVQKLKGGKVTDEAQIKEVQAALEALLRGKRSSGSQRPMFDSKRGATTGRMQSLMGE